jgi:hypothetical protein
MINAHVVVSVEYTADVVSPKTGQIYSSSSVVYNDNKQLLVDVEGMFSILIRNCFTSNGVCTFSSCDCCFDLEHENIDNIYIIVADFKNGKFMAIGEHKHVTNDNNK